MFHLKGPGNTDMAAQEPGDYIVNGDKRAVYSIHKDGSLRRIKNKAAVELVQRKLAEREAKEAQQKAVEKAPLTSVDSDTLMRTNLLLSGLGSLALPPR